MSCLTAAKRAGGRNPPSARNTPLMLCLLSSAQIYFNLRSPLLPIIPVYVRASPSFGFACESSVLHVNRPDGGMLQAISIACIVFCVSVQHGTPLFTIKIHYCCTNSSIRKSTSLSWPRM